METGNIYCVDDDSDILLLYKVILGKAGHQIKSISNGEEALKNIYEKKPDLILLDENMAGVTGMEICNHIRSDKTLPFIPIIMVTGVDSREGKIKSLENGVDDYILKPFDYDELLAKVQVMLRIKSLYDNLLKTRRDLVKAERLAAVGQLAATMAHEVRNPLSIISTSVQFLRNKLDGQEEAKGIMDTILRKISDIDRTIRELLSVARPLNLKIEPVDFNQCIQDVVSFIREKCIVQQVTLTIQLDENLPKIVGDAENLQRVLLNIFINAINSMPQGGDLNVKTLPKGKDAVKVEIKDTGKGIEEEDIEHLFEPFFTKHTGGSGLGLFMVKTIVDELNGVIDVESEVNKGTTFSITLPVAKSVKIAKAMENIPDTNIAGEGSVKNATN